MTLRVFPDAPEELDFLKQCISNVPIASKSLMFRNTGFPKLKFKHALRHHVQYAFPPTPQEGEKEDDGKGEECYLTRDARIALGTLAMLHLCGQGQVYNVRAGYVQRDRIQPANRQTGRAVTGLTHSYTASNTSKKTNS